MQVHANIFPQVIFAEGAALATPAAGTVLVYAKADGKLYQKDDAGLESPLVTSLTTVLAMLTAAVVHNFGSDANYTLSDADAASSVFIAADTGPVLTTSRDMVFPALFSPKLFHNTTAQAVTVKKAGQAGTAIAAGDTALVFSGVSDVLVFAGGGGGTFVGGSLSVALNEAKGADIASAGTTDIGAATGNLVHVTGTTTITALGTIQAGTERVVVFDGPLTLTHHATSLILPTGASIVTAAGDVAFMRSEGGGNWRCVAYQRASGEALAASAATAFVQVMLSNMDTDLSTGTAKGVWFAPEDGELSEVWLALHDPSSSGVVRVDMNDSGGSVFTTRPSIDATEATSLTGTAAVLDGTITFSKGDKFTFDIDDAGTDAKGLQVTVGYVPL